MISSHPLEYQFQPFHWLALVLLAPLIKATKPRFLLDFDKVQEFKPPKWPKWRTSIFSKKGEKKQNAIFSTKNFWPHASLFHFFWVRSLCPLLLGFFFGTRGAMLVTASDKEWGCKAKGKEEKKSSKPRQELRTILQQPRSLPGQATAARFVWCHSFCFVQT